MLPQVLGKNEHACRPACAACCIVPSISSTTSQMPSGKPAFSPCVHLDANLLCQLFAQPERPKVCHNFKFDAEICGSCPTEARQNLTWLEKATAS